MGKNQFELLFTAAAGKTVFTCQNEPNPLALGSHLGSQR
jgi:hypothetical protein